MKIRHIAIFLILLVCLVGAVSAADDVADDTLDVADGDAVAVDNVQEEVNEKVNEEVSTGTDDTSADDTLQAQDNNDELKAGTKTVDVNNFAELTNAINGAVNDGENDTYVINLNPGTYTVSPATKFDAGAYAPNIIINGNGQSITSSSKRLTFSTGGDITIKNLTFGNLVTNSNTKLTLKNVVLQKTLTNNMNLTIEDSTISAITNNLNSNIINSTLNGDITNAGTLTIDELSTVGSNFKQISGAGKIYTTNTAVINRLKDNYIFVGENSLVNTEINTIATNYGRLLIENSTISKLFTNYGEITIKNSNTTQKFFNYGNMTLIKFQLSASDASTNYGDLTFTDSIINASITNNGNITIDDDTIFGENFKLTNNEGSNLITNNDDIKYYLNNYWDNYIFENVNINLNNKKNYATLYFINCNLTCDHRDHINGFRIMETFLL